MPVLQSVIADMAAASYGYAYVTEAADFSALTSYWATLVGEPSVSPPPQNIRWTRQPIGDGP